MDGHGADPSRIPWWVKRDLELLYSYGLVKMNCDIVYKFD